MKPTIDRDKARRAANHPDRPGELCRAEPGRFLPLIDHGRCEGKRDCVDVCPHDVFRVERMAPDDFAAISWPQRLRSLMKGRMTAYARNADQCRACGLCVVACPEKAITLTAATR